MLENKPFVEIKPENGKISIKATAQMLCNLDNTIYFEPAIVALDILDPAARAEILQIVRTTLLDKPMRE